MKMQSRFLLKVFGLLLVTSGSFAQERFSNGFTQKSDAFFRGGFWWSETNPGFGLDLHRAGDQIVGIWATYDPAGDATWYFGTATRSGNEWVMPLSRYTWDGQSAQGQPAGEIRLTFDGGYAASMNWQLGAGTDAITGSETIAPLIGDDRPTAVDQTGFWYDPAQSGFGYSVATQGDLLMSVMYFYDAQGQPRWAWADNLGSGRVDQPMTLLSFTGTCPGCDHQPLQSVEAGGLQFAFVSETLGGARAEVALADRPWASFNAIALLSDRPSGRKAEPELVPVTNPQLLAAWFDDANASYPLVYTDSVNFSPAAPLAQETSTTNLQETGVDEADVVKNDGEFVYALATDQRGSVLRILAMDAPNLALEPLAELPLFDGEQQAGGLYLVDVNGRPLLIAVSGLIDYRVQPLWFAPEPWFEQTARLQVFDVTNRQAPLELADIQLDGTLFESRVVDATLYLVSRDLPPFADGQFSLADLPHIQVNGGAPQPLVQPGQVLVPPQTPGGQYADLVTISAFDLGNPAAPPQTLSFLGLPETLYASTGNIYLTSSRYGYGVAPLQTSADALIAPAYLSSHVHRFELVDGGIRYAASGEIAGFSGAGRVNPSFAFSEHDGHLRVVSQGIDGDYSQYRLSVLKLAPEDGQMPVVGFIPNADRPASIGKPGELLYGLRYLDERLYAVTFKNIDPLYVIDLSDPGDPRIAGELEITGFSNYLHPLPGNLLLGVGKGAIPVDGPGDGDFAWYQGLQVSLFDVSDPALPLLKRRIDLGRRGSESSLLYSHHAFALLPESESRPTRFAIPLVIHDAKDPSEISEQPEHFYDYRLTGLGMFELQGQGAAADLVLTDTLVTHSAESDPGRDSWLDAQPNSARAVISPEVAWFYLRGDFYAAPWGQGSPVTGPY